MLWAMTTVPALFCRSLLLMKLFPCAIRLISGINVEPIRRMSMDKERFTQLALAQQRRMYRIAVSYTASSADAEDAMQEALLRAWDKRDSLRDESLFATWLTRILINECKSLLRKRRKQFAVPALPNLSTPPEDERAAQVRQTLFAMPERYRVPLVLNLLEGYTMQGISEMLRLPLGTVKTRIARGKKQLKEEVLNNEE